MFSIFKKKEPMQLWFTTDIHCHIIPGVDDGSPDPDTSVELVRRMQGWGLKRIIASPHVTQDTFENTPATLAPAFAELKSALISNDIDIQVSYSAEYRMDDNFLTHVENEILIPIAHDYLLVENSFIQEPWNIDQLLFDLKVKGFRPILAHPERYRYYHSSNRKRYEAIHAAGTMFQINLLSLAGYYGKEEKAIAEWLIEKGMADFIGTDLHNHRHADAIDTYLSSRDCRRHTAAFHPLNDATFHS